MIYTNNNMSVVPFYDNIDYQNGKKWYAYGKVFPLLCPKNYILPFQIVIPANMESIQSVVLYTPDKSVSYDITDMMLNNGLKIVKFPELDYNVVIYNGNKVLNVNAPIGCYMMSIGDSQHTYWSDIITWVDDISNLTKIEWWNEDNQYYTGGCVVYDGIFKNRLYIPDSLGKPDYEYQEEGEERDGLFFPQLRLSFKKYNTRMLAAEYLTDVLRSAQLADYVKVISEDITYMCDSFRLTVKWQTDGDLANVDIEFTTDTVVKNVGKPFKPYDAAFILFDNNLIFGKDSETKIANLYSNIAWKLESKPDYLSASPLQGSGEAQINVAINKFEGRSERLGTIVYKGYDKPEIEGYLEVKQQGEANIAFDNPAKEISYVQQSLDMPLSCNTDSVTISGTIQMGSSPKIPIDDISRILARIELTPDGVLLANGEAVPGDPGRDRLINLIIGLTLPENTTNDKIYYEIFASGNGVTAKATITQQEMANISVDPTILTFPFSGGDQSLNVDSSHPWKLLTDIPGGLSISPSNGGAGTTPVSVHTDMNTGSNRKTTSLRFAIESDYDIYSDMSVRQNRANLLDWMVDSGNVPSVANQQVFQVRGNISQLNFSGTLEIEGTGIQNPIPDINTLIISKIFTNGVALDESGVVPGDLGKNEWYFLDCKFNFPNNADRRRVIYRIKVYNDAIEALLTITQEGAPDIKVIPSSVDFPAGGGSSEIIVDATDEWEIESID